MAANPTRIVLSTDHVPEKDRVPFFREELSRLLNVDVRPLDERLPRYSMAFRLAGPASLSRMEGSPSHYLRTRRHLRDSDEDFTFVLVERGSQVLIHNGHTTIADPGGAYLISNALPSELTFRETLASVDAVRVDGRALRALVRRPEFAAGRPGLGSAPALGLLRGYMRAFAAAGEDLAPELVHSFGLHLVDLVAAIIGATPDGQAQAAAGGIKAARLRKILSAIASRACDPDFAVDAVAAQLAVTTRYVNRLLEETGQSFSQHVVEHRLRRAWRLLSQPSGELKIAVVAYDCGFNDLDLQPRLPAALRRNADCSARRGQGRRTGITAVELSGKRTRRAGDAASGFCDRP